MESKVETYLSHNMPPLQKSIYLNKQGKEIQPPISHQHLQPSNNRSSGNPLQNLGRSNKLAKDTPLTISKINTKKQQNSFFDLFSCCKNDTTTISSDYDDCYVCNRTAFHKAEQKPQPLEEEAAYTSINRLKSRQQKPIQVFNDNLKNHEIVSERWTYL